VPVDSSVALPASTATGARRRARRTLIGSYAVLLFLLMSLNFALPRALPGQPIAALSDPRSELYVGDDARRAAVERYYGLDRPMGEQYARYLAGLVRGDLGTSIRYNAPVSEVIASRLPWSLLLLGTALVVATAVGMLGGIRSAWRRGRRTDRRLLTLFLAIDNMPVFFLASIAAYVLAVSLGWFPLSGARTPFSQTWGPLRQAVDIAHHLVLPATALALQLMGFQYLVMRASMVSELGSDHLLLGRAKGLSERVLKYRYAARNALLPAVTVFALQLGFAVTAAIFVESVFAYPGLGSLMVESVGERDYPTMQGVFLVLTVLVVGANLLADLLYRRLDPRLSA
jgi:peptide/nickel transport system permease protein